MPIELPEKKFESDGCSGGLSKLWIRLFKKPPPFQHCCFDHDVGYHFGAGKGASFIESALARLHDDNLLAKCMWLDGWEGKILSAPTWLCVRIGGGGYWKNNKSWGFGWD